MSNFLSNFIPNKILSIAIASPLILLSSTITTEAKPIKINTATTFDFKGCVKSSDGSDVICVGNFRNRDADKRIQIHRNMWGGDTSFTDFTGKNYIVDEIKVANGESCRSNCGGLYLTLVEGVDYQTYFVFKDVNLSSSQIALLQINLSGAEDIKIRKIPVSREISSSSEAGSENNNASSKPSDREDRETSRIVRSNQSLSPDQIITYYFFNIIQGEYKKSWNLLPSNLQRNPSIHPNGYNSFADWWKDANVGVDAIKLVSQNDREAVVNADVQYIKRNSSRPFRLQYTLRKDKGSGNWAIATVKYR